MGIPVQGMYMEDGYGAGKVSRLERASINSNQAKGEIGFGTAVTLDGEYVKQATKAPIYGIAIRRSYTKARDFDKTEIENDKWTDGETVGVLRDGTLAVQLSGDVKQGDPATVDTAGKFKTASGTDKVVGVFMSDGRTGQTAELQFRVMPAEPKTTAPSPTPAPSGQSADEPTNKSSK